MPQNAIEKMSKDALKNMTVIDWAFVKVCMLLIGFVIVAIFPQITQQFEWYWWWVLVLVLAGALISALARKPLLKRNEPKIDNYFMRVFRLGKQNMVLGWGIAKLYVILVGIALCATFPSLIIYVYENLTIFIILILITAIIPAYYVYGYKPTKQTTYSKARAKYMRSSSPFSKTTRATNKFVADDGKHQGGIMFFRKPNAHDAVMRSQMADEISPDGEYGWAKRNTYRRPKIQIIPKKKERK
jgi:membrane protein implicated in regulation of membrane protease activity